MTTDEQQELEATQFAMELLMPEARLRRDIEEKKLVFDIEDDFAVRKLAARYKVSVQLMFVRLLQLGIIRRR